MEKREVWRKKALKTPQMVSYFDRRNYEQNSQIILTFSYIIDGDDYDEADGEEDNDEIGLEEGKQEGDDESPGEIISMQDLEQMGFNIANYSSEDMASLTQITTEMNRRMQIARGMKRGRKV